MPNIGITIDLYSRYQRAFGFVAKLGFTEAQKALARASMDMYESPMYNQNNGGEMALYERGDSTFANFELENSNTNTKIKFAITENFELLDGVLAPPPMVSFSANKTIINTLIDNSDFEVVESFGSQSYDITIDGILVDVENHWYPSELIKQVHKLFKINGTYKVVGQQFADLEIEEIYFKTLSELSMIEGFNDTVKYKLNAKAIKPVEFFM